MLDFSEYGYACDYFKIRDYLRTYRIIVVKVFRFPFTYKTLIFFCSHIESDILKYFYEFYN